MVEQERYAFGHGDGCVTYGGCQSGFPTAVELQLQSAAAAVLGTGLPGTSLTRTRVVPVKSPKRRQNSTATGIVSVLLPCVSARESVAEEGRDVVVRNSTYHFSEDDDDEVAPESRRSTPQHRLNTNTQPFQTAGFTDFKSSNFEVWNDLG